MELQIKGKTLVKCVLEKGETEVVVPSKVKIIGNNAFYGCTDMQSVILPDKTEEIGAYAFGNCKNLKTISLPSALSKIGIGAFCSCKGLADESGFVIINDVFAGYYGIDENVKVPAGVKRIDAYAFAWLTDPEELESSVIGGEEPENPTGCVLKSVSLPISVVEISAHAFDCCKKLEKIDLPDGLLKIDAEAFWGCEALAEITLPEKLQEIGYLAFSGCKKLSAIEIPVSVKKIGANAFQDCYNLQHLRFVGRNNMVCVGKYLDGSDVLLPQGWIEKENPEVLQGLNCLQSISLPDGIEDISTNAFSRCSNLMSVTLSASLKRIQNFSAWYSPFSKCEKLRYVVVPSEFSIANSKNPKTIDFAFLAMAKKDETPFFFMKNTPDELAIPLRKPSCYAFAAMIADSIEIDPQIQAAYKEYIKKNKSKFKADADQHYGMKELLGSW